MTTATQPPQTFDLEAARRLYIRGYSCRQIAAELGLSYSRVAQRLRRAGVPMRPSGRPLTTPPPDVDDDMLVRMRDAGLSFRRIAGLLGVSDDMARDRYLRATGGARRSGRRQI